MLTILFHDLNDRSFIWAAFASDLYKVGENTGLMCSGRVNHGGGELAWGFVHAHIGNPNPLDIMGQSGGLVNATWLVRQIVRKAVEAECERRRCYVDRDLGLLRDGTLAGRDKATSEAIAHLCKTFEAIASNNRANS